MFNNIPIIYFHSVAPLRNKVWSRQYLTFNLAAFEEILKYFVSHSYKSHFLNAYFEKYHNGNNIIINFDDGYVDNWIYVFPLLKKYKIKATIYINPEFVDQKSIRRFTLEDYWSGRRSFDDINSWGFLSYDEMRIMEKSGLVDIQSHTLTHNKYPVSDNIFGFHHPGSNSLNTIGRLFPGIKPYYIQDENYESLIPYGYPFFEEKSAMIAKIAEINSDLINDIIHTLRGEKWTKEWSISNKLMSDVIEILRHYRTKNNSIISVESDIEYEKRVYYELYESKRILEYNLEKVISYCCWPHGDYNSKAHDIAREIGYKATSMVGAKGTNRSIDRFRRIGMSDSYTNIMTYFKSIININANQGKTFYKILKSIYKII